MPQPQASRVKSANHLEIFTCYWKKITRGFHESLSRESCFPSLSGHFYARKRQRKQGLSVPLGEEALKNGAARTERNNNKWPGPAWTRLIIGFSGGAPPPSGDGLFPPEKPAKSHHIGSLGRTAHALCHPAVGYDAITRRKARGIIPGDTHCPQPSFVYKGL